MDFLLYDLSCSLSHHLFRSSWQSGSLCSVMPISQLTRLPPQPTELFLDHDTEMRGCPHGFRWWTKLFPECGSQKMTVWILSLAAVVERRVEWWGSWVTELSWKKPRSWGVADLLPWSSWEETKSSLNYSMVQFTVNATIFHKLISWFILGLFFFKLVI